MIGSMSEMWLAITISPPSFGTREAPFTRTGPSRKSRKPIKPRATGSQNRRNPSEKGPTTSSSAMQHLRHGFRIGFVLQLQDLRRQSFRSIVRLDRALLLNDDFALVVDAGDSVNRATGNLFAR